MRSKKARLRELTGPIINKSANQSAVVFPMKYFLTVALGRVFTARFQLKSCVSNKSLNDQACSRRISESVFSALISLRSTVWHVNSWLLDPYWPSSFVRA